MCVVAKVNLGASCVLSEECLDEFASCEHGKCVCQSQYFNQNNRCGMYTLFRNKTHTYVFDYNSGNSLSIFVFFIMMESGSNTPTTYIFNG